MRSVLKDTNRMVTLSTVSNIPGTADSSGAFSDGTPWRSVRTGVGEYDIFFDPRLLPLSGAAGALTAARNFFYFTVLLPGWVHVRVMFQDSTANDTNFDLTLHCLDART